MPASLQTILDRYNALSERERISVLLLLLVAIIVIFFQFFISPMSQQSELLEKQIISTRAQVAQLEKQYANLLLRKQRDPDYREKQKIRLLDEQISALDVRLKEKMHGLIEPKQMAKVLEKVLNRDTDLKIIRVQSLGAKPLAPIKTEKGEAKESLGIYRHVMQIEFKGTYLSTLQYLKKLDALPWKFYWDALDLKVKKYPTATTVITVHTLSFHEGWIGV